MAIDSTAISNYVHKYETLETEPFAKLYMYISQFKILFRLLVSRWHKVYSFGGIWGLMFKILES